MISKRRCTAWFLLLSLATNSCTAIQEIAHISRVRPHTQHIPAAFDSTPLNDPTVSAYVNRVVQQLARLESADRLGSPHLAVTVAKTSRLQGLSHLTNPTILITRGMLNVITNEAELAALLSHEIGHKVLHRKQGYNPHSWKKLLLTDEELRAQWSRQREQEADEYGAQLAARAGYDPYALVGFFERLGQTQKHGLLSVLDGLTASHKDLQHRGKHLRQFLQAQQIAPGQGQLNTTKYQQSLAALKHIRTGDAVNPIGSGRGNAAATQLAQLQQEIRGYLTRHDSMPVARFLAIMETLSSIAHAQGINPSQWQSAHRFSAPMFMRETLSQDTPLWGDTESIDTELRETLLLLSRIGVGFIPVVGDAVDLYEVLSGYEFGAGRLLTVGERAITAIGLLAGSGAAWRESAHGLELAIQEGRAANRVVADGRVAVRQAEEIVATVKQSNNRITVIGRRWDTAIAKDWPGHEILDLPKWEIEINEAWVQSAIKRKAKVYLASPQTQENLWDIKRNGPTVFAQELEWLKNAGYKQIGDYLISL